MGSIGKAIGAMKDQTSISLAKVTGAAAPDLEVLVVKATTHDDEPADEKYLREILSLMASSRSYVTALVSAVSKRLGKTRNWKVALKSLILVHQLTIDSNPLLCEEIVSSARRGTRVLSMAEFKVEANSSHWDHAGFIRVYALYLEEKMELEVLERNDGIREGKFEDDRLYRKEPVDDYYTRSRDAKSGESSPSAGREKRMPLTEMPTGKVLRRFKQLWAIIRRVLACRPYGSAMNSRLILLAFNEVVIESFRLYVEICEALSVILDRFTNDENEKSPEGFDAYVSAAKMMDELVEFYGWCKEMGIARSSMYPHVQKITDDLLETLKGFLEKTRNGSSSPERSQPEKEDDPVRDIHEVPPQTDALRLSSPPEAVQDSETPPVQKQPVIEDLMDFTDYSVSAVESGNNMTLWEASPKEWQPPAAEAGHDDWELALVETARSLSKQKAEMGNGLHTLALTGIHDQESVNSPVSSTQLQYNSSLTLLEPEEKTIPVVTNDPLDPFAASLAVPPPLYIQAAEAQTNQQMMMQEPQLWQQYGMQGQVVLATTGGILPQPMVPQGNHMGPPAQSGYYYTPPY